MKYYVTNDGRLIFCRKDGTESVILYDVSKEFDAVITDEGHVHFVIQGLNGELIYLKSRKNTWEKFIILKSRKNVRKISGIKLAGKGKELCVFYVMEHTGKSLLVKHSFSEDNLYKEPEVVDIVSGTGDFCICKNDRGEIYVFYKNESKEWNSCCFDTRLVRRSSGYELPEKNILKLNAAFIRENLYFAYTIMQNNSTALKFCKCGDSDNIKTITFGISKNCIPEIIQTKAATFIQWSENGGIMQTDLGKSGFSKPRPLGIPALSAKIRQAENEEPVCDRCAVYNNMPYIRGVSVFKNKNIKEPKENMSYNNPAYKSDIVNEHYHREILSVLEEIKTDIGRMGDGLRELCTFLDKVYSFKTETEDSIISITSQNAVKDGLTGDVGEIDEDNIKLFESTDIDTVLPEQGR